jgi:hypothetical protein
MDANEKRSQFNLNYFLLFAFAVLFVQLTHEFAHWSMSEILGYDSFLTLNSSGPLSDYRLPWHAAAVDMAGPAFTVLSALIFFALIVRRRIKILYPFLLMCFAQRFLASIFGVFAMHNDEARLSLWINLPPHILPLIVCAFLFVLTFIASKKLMIGIKENIIDISVIYLFCFGIILLTQMFHWRLI